MSNGSTKQHFAGALRVSEILRSDLNKTLTWSENIKKETGKAGKARKSLWACRREFGVVLGLRAKMVHTGVVRPTTT